jgi:hypothetical protein
MKRLIVSAAVIAAAFAFVGNAFATSKPGAYQGTAGQVQGKVAKANTVHATTVGQLPFTGLDLAVFAGISLALMLAGVSVRRLGRARR